MEFIKILPRSFFTRTAQSGNELRSPKGRQLLSSDDFCLFVLLFAGFYVQQSCTRKKIFLGTDVFLNGWLAGNTFGRAFASKRFSRTVELMERITTAFGEVWPPVFSDQVTRSGQVLAPEKSGCTMDRFYGFHRDFQKMIKRSVLRK